MSKIITLNTRQEKIIDHYRILHNKITSRPIDFQIALDRLFEKLDTAINIKEKEWKEKINTHRQAMF